MIRRRARGAAYVEVLVIVGVVLVLGAVAVKTIGTASTEHAEKEAACIRSFSCGAGNSKAQELGIGSGGAASAGAASGGGGTSPGLWQTTKQVVSDFVEGLIKGDYGSSDSTAALVGNVVGGEIFGPVADARDWSAAASEVWNAPASGGAWAGLGLATVAFIPGMTAATKIARGTDKIDDVGTATAKAVSPKGAAGVGGAVGRESGTVRKTINESQVLGEGGFSRVRREGNSVIKEIKETVQGQGNTKVKLDQPARKELAETTAEFHNEVADIVPGGIVPKVEVVSDGVLKQPHVEGLTMREVLEKHPDAYERARDKAQGAINRAEDGLGLDHGGTGVMKNGWVVKVDDNVENFRFDKDGNLTSWFDPIAVFPCNGPCK